MRRSSILVATALAAAFGLNGPADAAPNPNAPPGPLMRPSAQPAWLGVAMVPATSGQTGVVTTQVTPGSPAERAGIRVGDRLKRVATVAVSTPGEVQRLVSARAVGDVVPIVFERDGRELSAKVELAARPSPEAIARTTYLGKPAPSLTGLATVNGPALTTEWLKNRVVVIDFWAVWCVPCRLSLPMLSAMQARYGPQGLTVLSITSDPAENAASFARELSLRTSIVVDPEGTTSRAYGVNVLPTTFVIDRRGVVREVVLGYDRAQDARLEALVRELLAEPGVDAPKPAGAARPAAAPDAGVRAAPDAGKSP